MSQTWASQSRLFQASAFKRGLLTLKNRSIRRAFRENQNFSNSRDVFRFGFS